MRSIILRLGNLPLAKYLLEKGAKHEHDEGFIIPLKIAKDKGKNYLSKKSLNESKLIVFV